MANLFEKQSRIYSEARPTYPADWFSKLASLTPFHKLAWDVGTGNGQAAVTVAEHYKQVIGTDVSEAQLRHAIPHPRVRYVHTPPSASDDELASLLGGEDSVDLVTVAQAVHWLDLPAFYSLVHRVLRKPGGVIAVWGYSWAYTDLKISSSFDGVMKRFFATTLPYWDTRAQHLFEGYRTLPFPFESVGLGSEGQPACLDMEKEMSFEGLLGMVRSFSAVVTAKERGVELLGEEVVREMEDAWGGATVVRPVTYKAFMLAGTPKLEKQHD